MNMSSFCNKIFRGFRSTGGRYPRFPIDFAGHRYNSAAPVMRCHWQRCLNLRNGLSRSLQHSKFIFVIFSPSNTHFFSNQHFLPCDTIYKRCICYRIASICSSRPSNGIVSKRLNVPSKFPSLPGSLNILVITLSYLWKSFQLLQTTPDSVCDRQPPTSWSCNVHDAAPSATEHLLSLQLVYGTICHLSSALRFLSEHLQEASQDKSLPVVIQPLTFCFNCFLLF